MAGDGRLAGKKALVTGAGTGIGREIALEFARQGADVALHYSHSDAGARTAVEEIRRMGRSAEAFSADFASVPEAVGLAERAVSFLGGIHCLVNNAGITFTRRFTDISPEQFDLLLSVNLRAQFFLTQRLVRDMLAGGGGAICNLSSIHGLQSAPHYTLYAATKGAIIAYTRALAVELACQGIRVNAIAPGWITVENYAKAIPDYDPAAEAAAAEKMIPAGRAGNPRDIARLAAFLCSDAAEFIVGQVVVADGGSSVLSSLSPDFRSEMDARWGIGYVPGA